MEKSRNVGRQKEAKAQPCLEVTVTVTAHAGTSTLTC